MFNGGRDDRILLEGPQSRSRDLWLVLRTVKDFVAGFRRLHFVGPCVTVFGSARFTEDHPYYELGANSAARVVRTLRWLTAQQFAAQIAYRIKGRPHPIRWKGAAPRLASQGPNRISSTLLPVSKCRRATLLPTPT